MDDGYSRLILLAGVVLLFLAAGFAIWRFIRSRQENVTEEDIKDMVNEGHEQGVLEAREAEMITNIFELDDKDAGDIMTHRKNLVALDGSMTLKEAVNFILKEGYNSRYPVYEKDIDDITGILHMKDALIAAENGGNASVPICEIEGLLREAHFIPETRNIDSLFKEMQSQKIHMVIVVDEYGQTAGIVTMEDILEEIVGNIFDEHDTVEEQIVEESDGSYLVDGMTDFDEVCELLEIPQEETEDFDTLSGFLVSRINKIPNDGEVFRVEAFGFEFDVLLVENKVIRTVRVKKLEQEEAKE